MSIKCTFKLCSFFKSKVFSLVNRSALLQKWLGMENMTSASLVDPGQVIQEIEHRAMWAKYGL